MKLQVQKISSDYEIKLLGEGDILPLYNLCVSNPGYYRYMKCEPDRDTLKGELTALPPGKRLEDKYFAGIYRGGQMIAILDLIVGYPDPETAFIGWFMVDGAWQGRGFGRKFVAELWAFLKANGFSQVRLGCIVENVEGRRFWERNGFDYTGKHWETEHYTVLVMEKTL